MILSAAYKWIAIAVMLTEINHCVKQLNLPCGCILNDNVRVAHVGRPDLFKFSGRIETDNYFFVFYKSGRLSYIVRKGKLKDVVKRSTTATNLISNDQAYNLASQWLASIDVDVARLEQNNKPTVRQRFVYDNPVPMNSPLTNGPMTWQPYFDVRWGDWNRPTISVVLNGETKELESIRQEVDSYSRRPKELILGKNIKMLLEIPDVEFEKYTSGERGELLAKCKK
jgi:hypothetical protein